MRLFVIVIYKHNNRFEKKITPTEKEPIGTVKLKARRLKRIQTPATKEHGV